MCIEWENNFGREAPLRHVRSPESRGLDTPVAELSDDDLGNFEMDLSRQGLLGIVPTTPAAAADHCRGARDALMRSRPAGSHARTPRARSQAIRAQLVRVTLQLEQEREAATNQRAELVAALRAHQAAAVDDMERQNARQAALLAARDEAYSETLRRSAETAAAQLRSQATAQETALAKAQAGLEREQQLREKDSAVRPRARPPSPCSQDSQLSARQAARARVDQLRREHAKQVRYSWGGAARSGAGRGGGSHLVVVVCAAQIGAREGGCRSSRGPRNCAAALGGAESGSRRQRRGPSRARAAREPAARVNHLSAVPPFKVSSSSAHSHEGPRISFGRCTRGAPQRHRVLARLPEALANGRLCDLVEAHLGISVTVGPSGARAMGNGFRQVELVCASARDASQLIDMAPVQLADLIEASGVAPPRAHAAAEVDQAR